MKVRELIKALLKQNQDAEINIVKTGEGEHLEMFITEISTQKNENVVSIKRMAE